MQELEQMISIYHTLFLVFLVLGLLLLVVSVVLFFRFDIRRIFDMKTGRAQKRTIQKMEEINAQTGKLRQDMVANTPPKLKGEERITYPVTASNPTAPNPAVQKPGQAQTGNISNPGYASSTERARTEPLGGDAYQETSLLGTDTNETTVLSSGGNETTLLSENNNETTVLSQKQMQEQRPKVQLPGMFKIEKEILWIHTQEILE